MLGTLDSFVPGDDFTEYAERLQQFFILNDVNDQKKVASLLTFIGQETYSVLKKLVYPDTPKNKTFNQLIEILQKHFSPEINEIPERYKFHMEDQKDGQSISDYIIELKSRAQKCKFGAFLNEALRDRFVFGVKNSNLRSMLLKEKGLTFDNACATAINWEMAEKESREKTLQQNVVRRSRGSQRNKEMNNSQNNSRELCRRCGMRYHDPEQCPAKKWNCHTCGKTGHTSKVCYSSKSTV